MSGLSPRLEGGRFIVQKRTIVLVLLFIPLAFSVCKLRAKRLRKGHREQACDNRRWRRTATGDLRLFTKSSLSAPGSSFQPQNLKPLSLLFLFQVRVVFLNHGNDIPDSCATWKV